jgi:hypothetical protein
MIDPRGFGFSVTMPLSECGHCLVLLTLTSLNGGNYKRIKKLLWAFSNQKWHNLAKVLGTRTVAD